jgi:hypothetical protein
MARTRFSRVMTVMEETIRHDRKTLCSVRILVQTS